MPLAHRRSTASPQRATKKWRDATNVSWKAARTQAFALHQEKDPYPLLDVHHSGQDLSLGASFHWRGEKRQHFPSTLGPPLRPLRLLLALNLLRRQPLRHLHDAEPFTAPTTGRRHTMSTAHTRKNTTSSSCQNLLVAVSGRGRIPHVFGLTFLVTISDVQFHVHVFRSNLLKPIQFLGSHGKSIEISLKKSLMPSA